jgi:hypothetical protein
MTLRTALRFAAAWLVLALGCFGFALAVSPELRAQSSRIAWMADGTGGLITSALEGSLRGLHVILVDPDTNLAVDYVTDDRDAGTDGANTLRTTEATDSQLSAGVGATSDAAATVGSTGSLTAKLRLITSQLDAHTTALQLIDDDQVGATSAAITSAASTNATNVKASAGRLLGAYVVNTTTTIYYLRFYNLASAPTCSSATGYVWSFPIPPASAAGQAGGFSFPLPPSGIAFSTGVGYCLTGGGTSTDNTSAATGVFGVLAFK